MTTNEPIFTIRPDDTQDSQPIQNTSSASDTAEPTPEKKELTDVAKIIIAGPPNSGKSVFTHELLKYLPSFNTNYIDAQPDATGLWYLDKAKQDQQAAKSLQVKGKYSDENVSVWKEWIKNSSSRVNLIDIGGKIDKYTEELCSEANSMIIVTRYPAEHPETQLWVELAKRKGLHILGIYQTFLTQEEVPEGYEEESNFRVLRDGEKEWESEGFMVGLSRESFVSSSAIGHIAQRILERVPPSNEDERIIEKLPEGYDLLKLSDIADWTHLLLTKVIVNGVEQNILEFKPEILPTIVREIKERRQYNQKYAFYGNTIVQWFFISLVHYSYPADIDFFDERLEEKVVDVNPENNLPNGEGFGPLQFEPVRDYAKGSLIQHSKTNRVYLQKGDFEKIIPPEVDLNKPVYIAGATAHWANAKIALAYARIVPAVYMFDPRKGFVCCITNDEENFPLGSVVNDPF
jgi:GTPase SAR1 family protein